LGSKLLKHVQALTEKPVLIGTWAAATWAIDFYRRNGFTLVTEAEKTTLLKKYWSIPERQIETSVVLADKSWSDKKFAGSIPKIYDAYLVPLIFEPYAADLAARLAPLRASHVLEIAAGTGAVTRRLAATLPADTSIIATDLNPPMLEAAKKVGTARPVEWRQADAMQLPFDDASFDAVVCQFGAMFFPDKGKAFAEARRVLRPGGTFLFNVWDRIEENEFADEVTKALATVFPRDPPRFMARIPHGYHERGAIERDLYAGGFMAKPRIETVAARSRAASPRIPAMAYCEGTPLRSEIEARDASRLAECTQVTAKAIEKRFGAGAVDGKIQAHVVTIAR
jgi:SAM-dependent methyltransferase